jgi:hypothetical protein
MLRPSRSKVHLVVVGERELVVAYEVTRASSAANRAAAGMVGDLEERHRQVPQRPEALVADRACDDVKVLDKLWERDGMGPVIWRREA